MSTPWRLIEVPSPPAGADATWDWTWVYEGYSRIRRDAELETWGNTDRWAPTPFLMAFLVDDPWRRVMMRAAVRADGGGRPEDVLGVAEIKLPLQDDTHLGFVGVVVDAACRGQGIGAALANAAEDVLVQETRTVSMSWTAHAPEPDSGPGVVTSPTGSGRINLNDPGARFAVARGFRLEQVARASQLDVPAETAPIERLMHDAARHAGPDYRVHTWNRTVPERFHAGLAILWGRMSTDAPTGDLELDAQRWDAARVAAFLERQARAQQQNLLAAVEHVPSGTLTGFTSLSVPEPEVDFGFQGDTLVVPEHRGRRLGMLVKAANLLRLIELRPRVRRVHTVNAEENAFMLAINVALGYRSVGVTATWQKRLG